MSTLARNHRSSLLAAQHTPQYHDVPYFFSSLDTTALTRALSLPYMHYIEIGSWNSMRSSLELEKYARTDFYLSFTNAYFFNRPSLALEVVQALSVRLGVKAEDYSSMETCLHEAFLNSLMHGNLQISRHDTEPMGNKNQYQEIIEALKIPENSEKRITLHARREESALHLTIQDEGAGFSLSIIPPLAESTHGRGLHLIQSLVKRAWVGAEGNDLHLIF